MPAHWPSKSGSPKVPPELVPPLLVPPVLAPPKLDPPVLVPPLLVPPLLVPPLVDTRLPPVADEVPPEAKLVPPVAVVAPPVAPPCGVTSAQALLMAGAAQRMESPKKERMARRMNAQFDERFHLDQGLKMSRESRKRTLFVPARKIGIGKAPLVKVPWRPTPYPVLPFEACRVRCT